MAEGGAKRAEFFGGTRQVLKVEQMVTKVLTLGRILLIIGFYREPW